MLHDVQMISSSNYFNFQSTKQNETIVVVFFYFIISPLQLGQSNIV